MALVAAALAAYVAWTPASERRLNVILVSIDTLRADHLGCYGYDRPTSPRIDAFAREAVLFEQTIAAAPSTLASHASMLTGLITPHHGASFLHRTLLAPQRLTLAEILRGHGYATQSWNGGAQMDRLWGLDQGFEQYRSFATLGSPSPIDRFETTVAAALDWLDGRTDRRPFFLFLHTYEVHHPYTPDPELRVLFGTFPTRLGNDVSLLDLRRFNSGAWPLERGDLEHIVASYDAEIRSVDRAFGHLIEGLRERRLIESTLVVLTSDHGEEFAEHGLVGWHSHTLFDELLHVPLIVRLPGGAYGGVRVSAQVRGFDVAPTILDTLGITPPAVFEGRSLLRIVGSPGLRDELPALSALDGAEPFALRSGGWKWISSGGLYDLRADPGELHNLRREGRTMRARYRAMRQSAHEWLELRPEDLGPPLPRSFEDTLQERLRALGYVE